MTSIALRSVSDFMFFSQEMFMVRHHPSPQKSSSLKEIEQMTGFSLGPWRERFQHRPTTGVDRREAEARRFHEDLDALVDAVYGARKE